MNGIFTAVVLYIGHVLMFTVNHSGSVQSGILAYSILPAAVCYVCHTTSSLCMFNSACCICQSLKNMIFTLSVHVLFKMSLAVHYAFSCLITFTKIALELKGQVDALHCGMQHCTQCYAAHFGKVIPCLCNAEVV